MSFSRLQIHDLKNIKVLARLMVLRWGALAAENRAQELFGGENSQGMQGVNSFKLLLNELQKF